MLKKPINKETLTMETMLPVKEVARLTNMSVPAFYTERNKGLLGFASREDKDGVWLIRVGSLVEHGFLTEDLEPTKMPTFYADRESGTDEKLELLRQRLEVSERVAELEKQLEIVKAERDALRAIADDRAKQLEMINSLIATMGRKGDDQSG